MNTTPMRHLEEIGVPQEFCSSKIKDFLKPINEVSEVLEYKGEMNIYNCIYFLVDKNLNVVYVGETDNFLRRIATHRSDKIFSAVYYIPISINPNHAGFSKELSKECEEFESNHEKRRSTKVRKYSNYTCLNTGNYTTHPIRSWITEKEKDYIYKYIPNQNGDCHVMRNLKKELKSSYEYFSEIKKSPLLKQHLLTLLS